MTITSLLVLQYMGKRCIAHELDSLEYGTWTAVDHQDCSGGAMAPRRTLTAFGCQQYCINQTTYCSGVSVSASTGRSADGQLLYSCIPKHIKPGTCLSVESDRTYFENNKSPAPTTAPTSSPTCGDDAPDKVCHVKYCCKVEPEHLDRSTEHQKEYLEHYRAHCAKTCCSASLNCTDTASASGHAHDESDDHSVALGVGITLAVVSVIGGVACLIFFKDPFNWKKKRSEENALTD